MQNLRGGGLRLLQYFVIVFLEKVYNNLYQSKLFWQTEGRAPFEEGGGRRLQEMFRWFRVIDMNFYFFSEDGSKFRNKTELSSFLKKKELSYKPDDFDFSVMGKNFVSKPTRRAAARLNSQSEAQKQTSEYLNYVF